MGDGPIPATQDVGPAGGMSAYVCRFTVESRGGIGGDWERSIGGATSEKRVTFEGYANRDVLDALIGAMAKVTDA